MKKLFKILASVLIVIIAAMIVLPIVFKDTIVEKVKKETNKNINAEVDFGDFALSLFRDFPHFTLSVSNVTVDGVDEFEGVRLAKVGELEATVDLFSLFGDKVELLGFYLGDADIHARINEDGHANWDIAKETADSTAAPNDESSSLGLAINHYEVKNTNVLYEDDTAQMIVRVENLNHEGSGDFTEDIFKLKTKTDIASLTYTMEGISYLYKVKTDAEVQLEMNLPSMKFTFEDNTVTINALPLQFDGWLELPNEKDIVMDLKFSSPKTDFKEVLSLVPVVFMQDFGSIKASGKMALNGTVKGTSNETQIPAFDINLMVENGTFQYPDLPKAAENIQVKLNVKSPGGNPDNTVIDLSKFHVELGGDPIDAKMYVSTPVSDPNIDGFVKANVNLANMKDVIPAEEGESMTGTIMADVTMKGKMSSIDKGQYEQFDAKGNMQIQNFDYKSPEMPYDVVITNLLMNFSPQSVQVEDFIGKIGKSDIAVKGKINNFLGYYFRDELLTGTFSMNSKLMDLNEFMDDEPAETESAESGLPSMEEPPATVVEIPMNIDFMLNTTIDKMLYENVEMNDVKGKVELKNGVAILDHLLMNTMGGTVDVSGTYDATKPKTPLVAFKYDIRKVDVQQVYQGFETVQEMAPILEKAFGKVSSKMSFNGALDENMEPIYNTLTGKGTLQTFKVLIENSNTLGKIADKINMPEYKDLNLEDANLSFSFENGRVKLDPFDMDIGPTVAKVTGSNGFDQSLDYVMSLDIPTGKVGAAANKKLTELAGGIGQSLKVGDKVNLDVLIGGFATDPKISTSFKSIGGNVVEDTKEAVKEKIEEKKEEVKEEVKDKVNEQAQKLIADAEKQAAKIKADAKKAADKVRKEGYAKAKELEDQASNPIAKKAAEKAANKIRKESDEKADKIENEANTKADAIVASAKKKAAAME